MSNIQGILVETVSNDTSLIGMLRKRSFLYIKVIDRRDINLNQVTFEVYNDLFHIETVNQKDEPEFMNRMFYYWIDEDLDEEDPDSFDYDFRKVSRYDDERFMSKGGRRGSPITSVEVFSYNDRIVKVFHGGSYERN